MLCENCGKNYANVRYTQIINGVRKELAICEECSQKLGINHLNFDMPINFASYLSNLFGEYESESILPILEKQKKLQCANCKTTFEEFVNKGTIGCKECYETFKEKIDPILRNIHGADRHLGRLGKIKESIKMEERYEEKEREQLNQLEQLKKELKKAIKEERYEEAAKIRDEIKKIENS